MGTRRATGRLQIVATADVVNALTNTGRTATSQVGGQNIISQNFSTSGVASGQINRAWESDQISISNGANIEINLNDFPGQDIGAGSGLDAVGQALDMEEVVMILIKNTTTAASGGAGGPFLEVEPAPASGWTPIGSHTVALGGAIGPGGVLLKANVGEAGFDIQPGTSEMLRLTANGGNVTAQVIIFGRNDDDDSSSSSSLSTSSSSSSSVSSSSVSSSISSSQSSSSSS